MFQSSPGPKAGCCHGHTAGFTVGTFVPILTRPEGRMLPSNHAGFRVQCPVPILTRPEGRMLPAIACKNALREVFQSSPGPKAGCCAPNDVPELGMQSVPILTRPEGRMLRIRIVNLYFIHQVPILTRPEGRMLRLANP